MSLVCGLWNSYLSFQLLEPFVVCFRVVYPYKQSFDVTLKAETTAELCEVENCFATKEKWTS